jgi:hypothetical protein
MHRRTRRGLLVLLLGATLGCTDARRNTVVAPHDDGLGPVVSFLSVSDLHPAVGSEVTVTASARSETSVRAVASFIADLRYDPAQLTFVREVPVADGLGAFRPGSDRLTFAGATTRGFKQGRLFAVAFRVTNRTGLASLSLSIRELTGTNFKSTLRDLILDPVLRLEGVGR